MRNLSQNVYASFLGMGLLVTSLQANAVRIGGVEFPQGDYSFADELVSYNPSAGGGATPSAANAQATHALDAPEVPGNTAVLACTLADNCPFVSLGDGGSVVLNFADNFLTGSNSPAPDLWVFEVGPDIESTYVEISKDGKTWLKVGRIAGTTASIDLDAYGFTASDAFSYVKLTDDPTQGGKTGASVGADIDAIGAISTIINPEVTNDADKALCFSTNDVIKESHDAGYAQGVVDGNAHGYDLGYAASTVEVKTLQNQVASLNTEKTQLQSTVANLHDANATLSANYQTAIAELNKLKADMANAQSRIGYLETLPQLKGVLKRETETNLSLASTTSHIACNNGVGNGSDACAPGHSPIANDEHSSTKGNPAAKNSRVP